MTKVRLLLGGALILLIGLHFLVQREIVLQSENQKEIRELRQELKQQDKVFDQKIKEATREAQAQRARGALLSNISPRASIPNFKSFIKQLFRSHSDEAEAIIQCESGFNPLAYNPSGMYGLFQISAVHVARFGDGFTRDPIENIRIGYEIYKEQGWNPWTCKKVLS